MGKTTNTELLKELNRNKRKLQLAKKALKAHFVGLDAIIDQLITYIEPWYLIPELLNRPIIINLWGMTGVGKTDLIHRLVQLLNFADSYLKIELDNSDNYRIVDVLYTYGHSPIETGQRGILFFDEMQNYKTVEIRRGSAQDKKYDFKDFWELLNDGRLDLTEEIIELASRSYSGKDLKEKAVDYWSHNKINKFKHILQLKESQDELAEWTVEKFSKVFRAHRETNKTTYFDCTKCLILIAGNLDEAYPFGTRVADVAWDADEFFDLSKKVNLLKVKQALLSKFKPEQIARFGNNHIIYPSLSRKNYEALIEKSLIEKKKFIKTEYKIDLDIDSSVNKLIYDNGVFPTQGVRPLFTTLSGIVDSIIPNIVMNCLKEKKKKAGLSYDRGHLIITIQKAKKNKRIKIPHKASIDEIRKRFNEDELAWIAVHEAGHAVAGALLINSAPVRLKISPESVNGFMGYCKLAKIGMSDEFLQRRIKICLGGRAAEKLVFGRENMSAGTTGDIYNATHIASIMVRKAGLYDSHPVSTRPEGAWAGDCAYTDMTDSNKEIQKIITKCDSEIEALFKQHKDLIVAVAKELKRFRVLPQTKFVEICKKHGLPDVKCADDDTKIYAPYSKMLKDS